MRTRMRRMEEGSSNEEDIEALNDLGPTSVTSYEHSLL